MDIARYFSVKKYNRPFLFFSITCLIFKAFFIIGEEIPEFNYNENDTTQNHISPAPQKTKNKKELKKPQIIVIFVIDQFAYHYIRDLHPYFKSGLKTLLSRGIVYTHAYVPHGMPATATGHAGLSTGTYAKNHGIIGNKWFDDAGSPITCDGDNRPEAAIFSPDGVYDKGKSAHLLMADTISDQFVLATQIENRHYAYSISLKSRASTLTIGRGLGPTGKQGLGRAIWFDDTAGCFTSSKAYFKELPQWLKDFNETKKDFIFSLEPWKLRYNKRSRAYRMVNPLTYDFVPNQTTLIGRPPIAIQRGSKAGRLEILSHKELLSYFGHTPRANKLIFDCASTCLNQHAPQDHILLWICISSTDKLGHDYGPSSCEVIDMIYHLDKQLEDFMKPVCKKYGNDNVLFVLTADHGVIPIVELLQNKGLSLARRINPTAYIPIMNDLIKQKHGIENIVLASKTPQFFLDMPRFNALSAETRESVVATIKGFLLKHPGIKSVWTFDELMKMPCHNDEFECFFKNQLFAKRSGYITMQTYPYAIDSNWKIGTDHRTPYEYDTHIPLILYQPNVREKKRIARRVLSLQLANTLADILEIARPSASTAEPLPKVPIRESLE